MTFFDQAVEEAAIRSAIEYGTPALVLFIAQTVLCLRCTHKKIRLIPTFIVAGMTLYHLGILIAEIPSIWMILSIPYLLAYVAPSVLGVGLAWAIYVIKLVITEYRQIKS